MYASFMMIMGCIIIAWFGSWIGLGFLFGIILPYLAVIIFIVGMIKKILYWAKAPVPFAIPTTGGQAQSLDFIKADKIDCPMSKVAVFLRMLLEVLCFRSLMRNTKASIYDYDPETKGPRASYFTNPWLWFCAILFHYSLLVVFIRHFRFFMDPVCTMVVWLENLDGIMEIGNPRFFWSGGLLLIAICCLLARRIVDAKLRQISLMNDYFPLFLLLAIVGTGICLRYFDKADIAQVKVFIMGLVNFSPVSTSGVAPLFFVHLTLVSILLIYFPFSKLTHMVGIFFSPTRNLPCNTREVRHINPWNPPKEFFTYREYEDTYREAMAEAGLPLEKQPEQG